MTWHTIVHIWKLNDNFLVPFLFFLSMDSEKWTQISRLVWQVSFSTKPSPPSKIFLIKSLSPKMNSLVEKKHTSWKVIKVLSYFSDTSMTLTLIPESNRYAKNIKLYTSNPQEIESKTLPSRSIWLMNTESKWCVQLRNKLSPHEEFDNTKNCYTRWEASTNPMF